MIIVGYIDDMNENVALSSHENMDLAMQEIGALQLTYANDDNCVCFFVGSGNDTSEYIELATVDKE